MHVSLVWSGSMKLHKFRTSNKVKEDEEKLSVYCKFKGNVSAEMFSTLTGVDPQDSGWRNLFWGQDEAPRHPAIEALSFDTEANDHIVELLGYRDEAATIRRWKLTPAYGMQWAAQFEVLLYPENNAVVGKLAHAEGHEVSVNVIGGRNKDAFEALPDADM